ncbi:lysozyme 1-like [Planococcus citri]|uniref:lysozyme 1-like n=1 Tax=Planococcus citri TaxID=170843 RepID=UPI0031F84666
MKHMCAFYVFTGVLLLLKIVYAQQNSQEWPPGWTEKCIGCICEAASGCNQTIGCLGEFCGMFLFSRSYWVDSGSPVILGDDPNNQDAFVRCAVDSYCASRAVNQYIQKFIQDCNHDGSLSCDDYARMHFFGFVQCDRAINRTPYYRVFQRCFQKN